MCLVDDGDPADFYAETWRRARKDYRCCECGRSIAAGERYRYCVYKYEDQVIDHRTCCQCTVAEDWLRVECNGWLFGFVDEDLAGHLTSIWSGGEEREVVRPSRPARLLVGMRRRWRRFDGTGLMEATS